MRPVIRKLILAACLVLTAPLVYAGHHLNGTWMLDVVLPGQEPGTAQFELSEVEGGKLTGTYTGVVGTAPVSGMVNGADVEFSFDSQLGEVTYKGTYAGGKLTGTCDYGMIGQGSFAGAKSE